MVLCKEECSERFLSNRCQSEQIEGVWSEGALTARLWVNMADPLSFHTASLCSSVPLSVLSRILADRINKCPAISALLVFGSLSESRSAAAKLWLRSAGRLSNFPHANVQTHHMTATLGNIWMCLVSQFQSSELKRQVHNSHTGVCVSVHVAGRHAPIQGPQELLPHHSNAKVSLGVTVQYIIHTKLNNRQGILKYSSSFSAL